MKCKIVNIAKSRTGSPIFYLKINNEKIYSYGIRGIKADFKICLTCTKTFRETKNLEETTRTCGNTSFIARVAHGYIFEY